MPDFKDFLKALKDNLSANAEEQLQEFVDGLVKDGEDFVKAAEADLKAWSEKLAAGEMTRAGFELAVRGKADLAKMEALKQAGYAAIRIDKLKKSILDTVVSTASEVFLP